MPKHVVFVFGLLSLSGGLKKEVRCILRYLQNTPRCVQRFYIFDEADATLYTPLIHQNRGEGVDARRDDDGVLEVRLEAMTK